MSEDWIHLPRVPREISALTGRPGPSYRTCYVGALDGRFPAEQGPTGRWMVRRADLPAIAEALGQRPHTPVAAAA